MKVFSTLNIIFFKPKGALAVRSGHIQLNLSHHLREAECLGRLSLTVPWVVEFLAQLDQVQKKLHTLIMISFSGDLRAATLQTCSAETGGPLPALTRILFHSANYILASFYSARLAL